MVVGVSEAPSMGMLDASRLEADEFSEFFHAATMSRQMTGHSSFTSFCLQAAG